MPKATSPFAGMTLTDQSDDPSPGPDQRLFARYRLAPPTPVPPPIKEASKVARKQATLEPRILGTLEIAEEERPMFDITAVAYHSNTFAFTDEELEALEDVKTELRRRQDLRVSKYDLIRCGLHCLLEDYRRNGETSFAVRRLSKRRR
jgi:hypothetical protein